MDGITFGQKIKKRRKQLNISQGELGDLSGLSVASISKYESGLRIPKLENAQRLAKVLDIDLGEYPTEVDENFSAYEFSVNNLVVSQNTNDYHQILSYLLNSIMRLDLDGLNKVADYTKDLMNSHMYDFS